MASRMTIEEARRWFAEDLRFDCHLGDERVVDAFAAVPRERFVGPGPWRIRHISDGYWSTPDADPRHLYHNVLVALDESTRAQHRRAIVVGPSFRPAGNRGRRPRAADRRRLRATSRRSWPKSSGSPARSSGSRSSLASQRRRSAILRTGRRPRCAWPKASRRVDGQWDAVIAFAGATAPPGGWLDALAPGGRILIPMTGSERWGFMLRLDRLGPGFAARSAGWVGFYPLRRRSQRR